MMRYLLQTITILTLSFSLTGCYNAAEQTLLTGNYEDALETALQKLKNERKKDDYLAIAEKAYANVLKDDEYRIERLKANGDPSDWGKIYDIYRHMEYRQNMVEPYLPLRYTDGKLADFPTYNYIRVIEEAREYAAEYHYQTAVDLLTFDKAAAREAYYELNRIAEYYRTYKDVRDLLYHAKEKGTNHVLLDFKEGYHVQLPPNFLNNLSRHNYEYALEDWTRLYRSWEDTFEYDMAIQITIERTDISPELIREVHFHEEREVADGTQPVIDSEGNYVVDSNGVIIQVPKYTTLRCHVTEWIQDKSARIYSTFEIFDNRYQQKRVDHRLEDNVQFNNNYASANGHIEILNSNLRNKLNNRPIPFPSNYDMIMQTSENLKDQIARAIDRYDDVLSSL